MIVSRIQRVAIIAACVLIAALAIFATVQTFRLSATQADLRAERSVIARMIDMTAAADRAYRAAEQRHAADTAKIEKDKADEISSIVADRDALFAELHARPRRPAASATPGAAAPEDGPGCTGSRLFADDAEFLVGEAARADAIRAEVKACYAQYDSLAAALEPLPATTQGD